MYSLLIYLIYLLLSGNSFGDAYLVDNIHNHRNYIIKSYSPKSLKYRLDMFSALMVISVSLPQGRSGIDAA